MTAAFSRMDVASLLHRLWRIFGERLAKLAAAGD
jgi:hypothetical protein